MTAATHALPAGFAVLEPFVEQWSSTSADERTRKRRDSSEADRVAFFEAAKDLIDAALAHLDAKPLDELDAADQRLMNLLLGFAHVALAVEMQGDLERRHAEMSQHMPITRSSADLNP